MKQRKKTDGEQVDEDHPELSLDTLKDLTASDAEAEDVKGGPTTGQRTNQCYCGTM